MAIAKPLMLRGVLHAQLDAEGFAHARYHPAPDLARFVEHYWAVDWQLTQACTRETLPHPVVHLVAEHDRAEVGGPATRRWARHFAAGSGRVFAIKFRVGGFRPFLAAPVATLANRVIDAAQVFGEAARPLGRDVLAAPDHHAAVAVYESFLRSRAPRDDAVVDEVSAMAARIASDHALTRIEDVANAFSMTPRALQRLFREYVGASPKWVIQRYRLHEAVARAQADTDWAQVAADLGYADQAHFIRDFKGLIGRAPGKYVREGPAKV